MLKVSVADKLHEIDAGSRGPALQLRVQAGRLRGTRPAEGHAKSGAKQVIPEGDKI